MMMVRTRASEALLIVFLDALSTWMETGHREPAGQ